jgi:alcohol dehydrogenase class IV
VPDRLASAADALRLPGPYALAGHLTALGARLGLPVTLRHLGLTQAGIARLAAAAAEDRANRTNPRMASTADYRAMIEAAL